MKSLVLLMSLYSYHPDNSEGFTNVTPGIGISNGEHVGLVFSDSNKNMSAVVGREYYSSSGRFGIIVGATFRKMYLIENSSTYAILPYVMPTVKFKYMSISLVPPMFTASTINFTLRYPL